MKPTGKYGPVWTAMVTPFQSTGAIDYKQTEQLIEHLIENGTDVLIVAGTTGESPLLSKEEKLELFAFCVKQANGRAAVVAGTGSNDTHASVELTKAAEKTGVDGVMLVTPYYNKPSQQGLFSHFKEIANETNLPVMLYNVPGRTGVNLEAETTIALANVKNIVAIKEASGNLEQIAAIIEHTPASFAVYSGDDSMTLPILALGGDGIVSVASHLIGKEMQAMIGAFQAGENGKAATMHRKLLPVMQALFLAPNPACVKYALNKSGIDVGEVKPPLAPVNDQEKAVVDQALAKIKSS
ncbi:4-hydroxy-tetrahydrodipicolinate synthase [Shouchella clausii]|nr:4-hydroxy-tetrahydrodipicolinate synthase [Shouchella clausii]